jgi:hypothetical protein
MRARTAKFGHDSAKIGNAEIGLNAFIHESPRWERTDAMQNAFACLADVRVLERLAEDFVSLRDGRFDTDRLASAPLLEAITIVPQSVHFLEGYVTGHPLLADGRRIVTSQLFGFMSGHAHYARTLNRWYRVSDFRM